MGRAPTGCLRQCRPATLAPLGLTGSALFLTGRSISGVGAGFASPSSPVGIPELQSRPSSLSSLPGDHAAQGPLSILCAETLILYLQSRAPRPLPPSSVHLPTHHSAGISNGTFTKPDLWILPPICSYLKVCRLCKSMIQPFPQARGTGSVSRTRC